MGNGVLLDTNCFAHVFNRNDKEHKEFEDFLRWLCCGPGYLVYGGSKYLKELNNTEKYRKVFTILHNYNKAIAYNARDIDQEQDRIVHIVDDPHFDDPHLPAILIIAKCNVVCTGDSRSFPFLSRRDIYDGRIKCPKFYTGKRCVGLLTTRYVGKNPCVIRKAQSEVLVKRIEEAVKKEQHA